jgi:2-hydroxychromene-2-carboxylate isomerase
MAPVIDYYFTPVSPFTYLGHERFRDIAARHGASVRFRPVDLLAIFPLSGGLPLPKRPPQRIAYRAAELRRWPAFLGLKLNPEPRHFPVPDALASQMIIAASRTDPEPWDLTQGLLRAVWAEDRDISDPMTVAAIADAAGLDGAALLAAAQQPQAAATRQDYTREAVDRNVFGAPTYVVDGEPFWGQDRLELLDWRLGGTRA